QRAIEAELGERRIHRRDLDGRNRLHRIAPRMLKNLLRATLASSLPAAPASLAAAVTSAPAPFFRPIAITARLLFAGRAIAPRTGATPTGSCWPGGAALLPRARAGAFRTRGRVSGCGAAGLLCGRLGRWRQGSL